VTQRQISTDVRSNFSPVEAERIDPATGVHRKQHNGGTRPNAYPSGMSGAGDLNGLEGEP